jgi:hypothetical protein
MTSLIIHPYLNLFRDSLKMLNSSGQQASGLTLPADELLRQTTMSMLGMPELPSIEIGNILPGIMQFRVLHLHWRAIHPNLLCSRKEAQKSKRLFVKRLAKCKHQIRTANDN